MLASFGCWCLVAGVWFWLFESYILFGVLISIFDILANISEGVVFSTKKN